jgi:hypothetical protein
VGGYSEKGDLKEIGVSMEMLYRKMSGYREMGGLRDMSVHREVVAFERWVNIGT